MRRIAISTPRSSLQRASAAFSSSSGEKAKAAPGTYGRWAYDLRGRLDREEARTRPIPAAAPSTVLSHAGIPPQADGNDALSPPIELATTFGRPPDGDYGPGGKIYARTDNATREALEGVVARMEVTPSRSASRLASTEQEVEGKVIQALPDHPPVCAAFSSGMAAVSAVLLAHPSPVRVVLPDDVYHGVPTQLTSVLGRHGVEWDKVDMTDLDSVLETLEKAVAGGGGSVVIWLETPSNPLCKITSVRAICDLADGVRTDANGEDKGAPIITTVVDSTWAPPPISNPLLLGADAVLHSGTKYLGGHSDVLLGIVTASPFTETGRWLGPELKTVQTSIGAVASPFDSFLTLRGLRTLHVRLERQCRSAMDLAEFLSDCGSTGAVERVHYPGLADHPGHGVAKEQMVGGYGGMLSFEVQDERMAMAVAGAVRTVRRGTSLGGTETLIEHRASIEPEGRVSSPAGLLRVSVGLEDVEDLKDDLDRAISVAKQVVPI